MIHKPMEGHIKFRGVPISYRCSGNGDALVLLHGFLESMRIWDDFVAVLSTKFKVITIDLPGHGKSGVIGEVQTMPEMAEATKAVLDELKITKCVMTGHSMGGYVCLAFAKSYPKLLQGFCLFNSTAMEDPPSKKKDRIRAVKVIRMNPKVFVNEAIPNLFAPGNVERFSNEIDLIKKDALKTPLTGITGSLFGMKDRSDQLDFVRKYEKPMLFIVGKQDPVMPYQDLQIQLKLSDKIDALELDGVGHMGFLEAKDETLKAVENFAEKCFGTTEP